MLNCCQRAIWLHLVGESVNCLGPKGREAACLLQLNCAQASLEGSYVNNGLQL
jgi:hypothetical protein